jgi:hypothetical protein
VLDANTETRKDIVHDPYTLNTSNMELLLHFTAITAETFSGEALRTDKITKFWYYNVPQIGLSHHYVLHLMFSATAYHLRYMQDANSDRRLEYKKQAEYYFQRGLSAFTEALAIANETDCGALYVSATLVCYCTFAAGPKGPNDLLICRVDDHITHNWRPVIKGLRLIHEIFDSSVLFEGLMEPLGPSGSPPAPDTRARCAKEGFSRVEWEVPIRNLGDLVKSSPPEYRDICLVEFDTLASIYEASYGDTKSEYHGPEHNRMIFGWLYRMADAFVNRVRLKDPIALLLLAYFAPLLGTTKDGWYIAGWPTHLLNSIQTLLDETYKRWIEWPRIQVGLSS